MDWLAHTFDGLLGLALLWLAWQAMHAPGLFRSVVSYMVFGLVMALIWVRLEAPDIALAEAAIGAGATGALLLSALARLKDGSGGGQSHWRRPGELVFWLPFAGVTLLVLAVTAWQLPAPGLGTAVEQSMAQSGVDNPVTAVLLNFRSFDTLLEIGVLLVGAVAIWSLGPAPSPIVPKMPSPALPALGRALFPVFVLAATYLLWRGSHAPGGAFQAGAVMGAGGILMVLAGARPWLTGEEHGPWRWLLSLGLIAMVAVAVVMAALEGAFFAYPHALAAPLILALEISAALSIALLMFAVYLCGRPPDHWHGES
ncbi:hydrogen gas-evolving membrane-bound hydrogenase subunit E [Aquisalimonas asiatica]|uniref:Multisubunit sodium/proton antiporter, MrpB subunit n=1 Tax=Aquisalimonas asiatica TaxID=406100 RepID=A0A1H8PY66_9GAMM|nr:hydrogen gas-evolving membrane-bound hydrogenase subunit E [Aquisalimonas asiatica]SEO46746.1 multisubunit sodium/proton antiporter, MrpB subunit [Aquisalimonas asiatica]